MSRQQATRRAVYAFVALAEAPMPRGVIFSDNIQIQVDSWPDLIAWATLLEIEGDPFTATYETGDTNTILSGQWGGWRVLLSLFLPIAEVAKHVDPETRARLEAVLAREESAGEPS